MKARKYVKKSAARISIEFSSIENTVVKLIAVGEVGSKRKISPEDDIPG